MSINPQYQQIYNQARDMQFRLHDFLGSNNTTANGLHQEMQHLVDDIEVNRNPRDIEARIKTIQNHMQYVEHEGQSLMSYDHANAMHRNFEDMRRDVRGFSNY